MYRAIRFDSIFYLKDFLNENHVSKDNIITVLRKESGLVELLFWDEEQQGEE